MASPFNLGHVFSPWDRHQHLKSAVDSCERELDQSIEVNRAEIGQFQILEQTLAMTSVTAVGESRVPMGKISLCEERKVMMLLVRLVQMEYDEINGKKEVVSFLQRLMAYAT